MKTNFKPKQLFLNHFSSIARRIRWGSLIFTLCLFGSLLPAQGQDPILTNIKHPMNTNVSVGATVSFRVYASSTNLPMAYQWQHEGTNLPSATDVTLVITNVTVAHAGRYQATVWNASGESTNTRTAALTVDPTFSKITGQPIATDREASELGAWCDYDGDGYLDLFVANSMNTTPEVKNSLYHNERNGSFTRVTNAVTARAANTWGSVWADYDNDGLPDLFMTHWNGRASELFRNLGGGQFATVSTPFLLAGADQIDGAWGDLDGDGWVDLVVSTWANKKDQAFRNLGDGRFQPFTTAEVGALVADLATTGASSFADFDNDGDPDIYVSCESGPAFLYRNQGGGRYEKVQLGSLPGSLSTVGGVWADFNNDGFFDLITTARDGLCTLHMSVGGQSFQDVTTTAGVVTPRGMVFGPAWGDVDNDGDLDLFVPYYFSTNLMFLNNGNGTFSSVDIGSPLREGVNDEGAVWADYDNDGFLDLFIACGEAFPSLNLLYRNNLPATGNTNHWLKVKLNGTASNRSGIGAKIRVRAVIGGKEVWQLRQIASNGAFASGTELLAHFGLGDATKVDTLRIEWPSGIVQEWKDVAVDQHLTKVESQNPNPLQPPQFTTSDRAADGMFQATVTCEATNVLCVLEASTNLVQWTKLSVRANTTGTMQFDDPGATNRPARFYRVVVP